MISALNPRIGINFTSFFQSLRDEVDSGDVFNGYSNHSFLPWPLALSPAIRA